MNKRLNPKNRHARFSMRSLILARGWVARTPDLPGGFCSGLADVAAVCDLRASTTHSCNINNLKPTGETKRRKRMEAGRAEGTSTN